MKPRFELKVNYKNKDQPLVFRAEGTLDFCCEEILDILCDEITSVTIKNNNDLLAQKEDRKECNCGKNGHALNSINCPVHGYTAILNKKTIEEIKQMAGCDCQINGIRKDCPKCNGTGFINPTPSPLEIEEIEEIEEIKDLTCPISKFETEEILNSLIRNQKKLYQYLVNKI